MNKKIKWDRQHTDLSTFDGSMDESDEYREFDMELIDVPVDQYVMVQERRNPDLIYKKKNDEYMKLWEKSIEENKPFYPDGISTPVLEFDEEGKLTNWQEGYRRGVYAQNKGEEFMPVWMAKKRTSKNID
jgi:hypothetical protein